MLRLISIGVVCTLLLIPIAGYGSNIISNEILLVIFTFGLGYVVLPAVLLKLWPTKYDLALGQPMELALADGNLLTLDFDVLEAAELEEEEDEGYHFLLGTTDGGTLYLCGQTLDLLVDQKQFPTISVRMFANRLTGVVYGVEPRGAALESWSLYGNFTEPLEKTLEDGRLYPQSIGELIDSLGGEPVARA